MIGEPIHDIATDAVLKTAEQIAADIGARMMNDPKAIPTREEIEEMLSQIAGYRIGVLDVFPSTDKPGEITVVLEGRAGKVQTEYTFKAGPCSKP